MLNDNQITLTSRHTLNEADNEALVLPYLEWSENKPTLMKRYPQMQTYLEDEFKELFNFNSKDRVLFLYDAEAPKDKSELRAILK